MLTLQYRGQTYSRNDAPVEQLHYDRTTFETFETRQNHARPVRQLTYRGLSYTVENSLSGPSHGQYCYRGVAYSR